MSNFEMVTIGDCVLYFGDNLAVMAGLERVDAVITDPPYIIKTSGGGKFRKTRTYLDEISDEGLADGFELDVFYVAERLGIQSLVTFYSELQEDIIYNYFKAMYFDRSIPMFWKKTNPRPFVNKSMQADLEFIRFGWRAPFYPQGEYVQKSRAYVMLALLFSTLFGLAILKIYSAGKGAAKLDQMQSKLKNLEIGIRNHETINNMPANKRTERLCDYWTK